MDIIDLNELNLIKDLFVKKDEKIESVLDKFIKKEKTILPVVDNERYYLGVIYLRDIINQSKTEPLNSKNIKTVKTIKEEDELKYQKEFLDQEIIPVIDKNNYFLGLILSKELNDKVFKQITEANIKCDSLINSSYNGILSIDKEGIITTYNEAAERIIGKKRKDVIGRSISVIDPNCGLIEIVEKKNKSINLKKEIDGKKIISNRSPIFIDGEVVGAVSVFLDISDVEEASQDLTSTKRLSKQLNDIIECSHDGLYICDNKGIVTKVNSAWEKISGFKREDIIGQYVKDLLNKGLYDNSAALETLKSKKTSTTMVEIKSGYKTGQKIMATGNPLFDDNGELKNVVVNVRDITEIELMKSQLEKTKELSMHYANELEKFKTLNDELDDFVATSPEMSKVLEFSLKASRVDSSVLVTGESGVGKGALVQKMHEHSQRADKQLITVNCGAIPENLIESELFGYEEGAFTGAKRDGKIGMFELASGGTIFLDEIGDLPYNLQVKLLNVIQNKEIMRVGGIKPIKVDTRIISATNKDLRQMIEEGKFREDLFYRINVININIPPLRERKEDIPKLILNIINKLNKKYDLNKSISIDAVEKLIQYPWPGNIRELQNTLERLVVMINENNIELEDLPVNIKGEKDTNSLVKINDIIPLKEAKAQVEEKILNLASRKYKTTREMAKVLKVNQSTVVRKLNSYKIDNSNKDKN